MAAITAIIAQPTTGVLKRSLFWGGRNKGKKRADQQLVCAHIRQEIRVHAEGGQKDGQQAQYNQQKDELADVAPFAESEKGNQQNRKNKVKLLFQR